MTDIPDHFKEALEQANAHSRAMIKEGIKIGRREALQELMQMLDGRGDVEPYTLAKIKGMLTKDAGQ